MPKAGVFNERTLAFLKNGSWCGRHGYIRYLPRIKVPHSRTLETGHTVTLKIAKHRRYRPTRVIRKLLDLISRQESSIGFHYGYGSGSSSAKYKLRLCGFRGICQVGEKLNFTRQERR